MDLPDLTVGAFKNITTSDGVLAGAAITWIILTVLKMFNKGNNENHKEYDDTSTKLITAQKDRIDFLEEDSVRMKDRMTLMEKLHTEDRSKWAQELEQMKTTIAAIYEKNKELLDLLALRNPEMAQALDKFQKDTAPKVDQLHEHLIPKDHL